MLACGLISNSLGDIIVFDLDDTSHHPECVLFVEEEQEGGCDHSHALNIEGSNPLVPAHLCHKITSVAIIIIIATIIIFL